jgi:hypothetical protein
MSRGESLERGARALCPESLPLRKGDGIQRLTAQTGAGKIRIGQRESAEKHCECGGHERV